MYKLFILFALMASTITGCANQSDPNTTNMNENEMTDISNTDTATFGSGCFWCTEAIFQELNGVISVESGYSGGKRANPTYDQVSSGASGHAEVTQIVYEPEKISFEDLLEVFWKTHDPTTLNRQGADVGTQYRSIIFYHNAKQKELAEKYKAELDSSGAWDNPIVTEISPYTAFYKAENYHQNYYNNNPNAAYCTFVIGPKLEKFRKVFKDKTKAGNR
ncbi:MAG: peptide-methionine (S)-S-oxide reductase MsrA [Lentimicrobium sp.]|jgi:peptide-methionine (S)-S-oxide reductase|nr:peptide-methionine (S)-S-oxide reductase MsrA [Lentimicrobium sp.]MDD2526753.1 peptide-methionine (S)-S-oxide reductase MsrA [Lentimicrobiaceae bacterium]MDD4596477.1 peptide-methionine (S)-S-oxide reductase MsrA [Lentimicrobiaceae bacterium]MDY0024719.1 peptide-methionine (S)-S-oxide reductase MsrA [Lentimicrobium sp.]